MRRYKVAQWATGNTGQRALREVIRHPSLDLVGVLVYDPAKNGADAGDLCGEAPVGIQATTGREAVISLGADCVVYMPRATGTPGYSRAGLTQEELLDDIVPMLEAGTNIVTTCTDLLARGIRLSEEGRARSAGCTLTGRRRGTRSPRRCTTASRRPSTSSTGTRTWPRSSSPAPATSSPPAVTWAADASRVTSRHPRPAARTSSRSCRSETAAPRSSPRSTASARPAACSSRWPRTSASPATRRPSASPNCCAASRTRRSPPCSPRIAASPSPATCCSPPAGIDAAEAQRLGIISRVVPHEQLREAALQAAREILQTPPMARMHVKRMLNERYGTVDYQTMFWALEASPEPREGMRAFMEKRSPSWVPEEFASQ